MIDTHHFALIQDVLYLLLTKIRDANSLRLALLEYFLHRSPRIHITRILAQSNLTRRFLDWEEFVSSLQNDQQRIGCHSS